MTQTNLPPLHNYLPAQPARTYASVERCIYCGSTEELSDEHIIPLGLGGRLVLPRASCAICSPKTSKRERTCLRTMYGPLRLLYGLPSRRKQERPSGLQLKVKKTPRSEWEYVLVPQERYPFLITFPYFEAPTAMYTADASSAAGPGANQLWIRGGSPHYNFKKLLQSLVEELGVYSVMPESKADVSAFCSLLAKVALSYLAAEAGIYAPRSRLAQIALGEDMSNCLYYIGSVTNDEPPVERLHDLSFGRHLRTDSILVRIRLLSKLGTPTYFVVLPRKEVVQE
jgi:HNH endonuclease